MPNCNILCPVEAVQQHPKSAGTIANEEIILRASFDPMHYPRGKLSKSFLRSGDLLSGQLSVWRASMQSMMSIEDLQRVIKLPDGQSLKALHGALAGSIREALDETGKRLFCVADDATIDDVGTSHPAHAHIKLCASIAGNIADTGDAQFIAAKSKLAQVFRMSRLAFAPV